eukprot:gene1690-3272_t
MDNIPSAEELQARRQQEMEMEERRKMILEQILEPAARDRLVRLALVKQEKCKRIEDSLIRMATGGQLKGKEGETKKSQKLSFKGVTMDLMMRMMTVMMIFKFIAEIFIQAHSRMHQCHQIVESRNNTILIRDQGDQKEINLGLFCWRHKRRRLQHHTVSESKEKHKRLGGVSQARHQELTMSTGTLLSSETFTIKPNEGQHEA